MFCKIADDKDATTRKVRQAAREGSSYLEDIKAAEHRQKENHSRNEDPRRQRDYCSSDQRRL